jgi:hypothetical protein
MHANSIIEVLEILDEIIVRNRNEGSRLGYFPALYRRVTQKVHQDIEAGLFEDGERMSRLDVNFANRYFDAYHAYILGVPCSRAWQVAFDATSRFWPTVLQHLLLGMNAHIVYDLGIAACLTCPGSSIVGVKKDFYRINDILISLIDQVQDRLIRSWPVFWLFDRMSGRTDERLAANSIRIARDEAWKVACELAHMDEGQQKAAIDELDVHVAGLSENILLPGGTFGLFLRLLRLGEFGTPRSIIHKLNE